MKKTVRRFLPSISAPLLVLLLGCALPAFAVEIATLDMGRALFESTRLGTTDRSCATCHPDGKGLDQVGDFSDAELKDIINACIRDALHGTRLTDDSQELNALLLYVRTFQGPPR